MTTPNVSIIIPCFNAAPWLEATLESALSQTWPHREILLVDDGSTDGSLEIARRFENRGVRIFSQANRGASAARNRGLAEATGDYLQYLDADDLLHRNKIECQLRTLLSRAAGTVASGRWGRFTGDAGTARFVPEPDFRDLTAMEFLLLAAHRGHMMHPAAWLTPRETAQTAGPWDETLSLNDDGEYFARVLLASAGIAACPDAISYYRSGLPASLSGRKDDRARESLFRSIELTATHMLRASGSDEVRQGVGAMYVRLLHEIYPRPKALVDETMSRIREFGATVTAPAMGPRAALLARLVGWKATRRLQDRLRS